MHLNAHHFAGSDPALPPLILLHGFASSAAEDFVDTGWPEAVGATGRTVIALDLPGHGGSPAVSSDAEATTSAVVRAILDTVDDLAPSGDFDVLGYSLGARLGWDLPSASARARRLVLGGLSPFEPFSGVDPGDLRSALGGAAPASPLVGMMAGMITAPGRDTASLAKLIPGLASEPFSPETGGPGIATLFVAGADDQMSEGIEDVVSSLANAHLSRVPGDHRGALDGAEFRSAALEFLQS